MSHQVPQSHNELTTTTDPNININITLLESKQQKQQYDVNNIKPLVLRRKCSSLRNDKNYSILINHHFKDTMISLRLLIMREICYLLGNHSVSQEME